MHGNNTTMKVAQPVDVGSPQRLAGSLESTLGELNGCRSDADIQRVSAKVEAIMAQMSDVSAPSVANRSDLLKVMQEAELALRNDGQSVKAGRMGKMRKLMTKLPKASAKKQRKLLREILKLSGQNAGVTLGKRGFCGSTMCFGVCATGSVLALAGASAIIVLAATGQLGESPDLAGAEDNDHEPVQELDTTGEETGEEAHGKKKMLTENRIAKLENKVTGLLEDGKLKKANKIASKLGEEHMQNLAGQWEDVTLVDGKFAVNGPDYTPETISAVNGTKDKFIITGTPTNTSEWGTIMDDLEEYVEQYKDTKFAEEYDNDGDLTAIWENIQEIRLEMENNSMASEPKDTMARIESMVVDMITDDIWTTEEVPHRITIDGVLDGNRISELVDAGVTVDGDLITDITDDNVDSVRDILNQAVEGDEIEDYQERETKTFGEFYQNITNTAWEVSGKDRLLILLQNKSISVDEPETWDSYYWGLSEYRAHLDKVMEEYGRIKPEI